MVKRGQQLKRREAQRQKIIPQRIKTEQQPKQLERRQRLFVKRRQERERESALVEKLVKDINEGKISNISQIPEKYRSVIGVTQTDLNKIQEYNKAKREANLWADAFRLAERVINSTNPTAIFSIGFSDNPYAGEAYRIRKDQARGYQERIKIIKDIISGKIKNVKIFGGRIWDTKTNIPITTAQASKRQVVDLIQKDLPRGETLIYDKKTWDIKGISSNLLKQTIPYTKEAVEDYSKKISKIPDFIKEKYAGFTVIPKKTLREKSKEIAESFSKGFAKTSYMLSGAGEKEALVTTDSGLNRLLDNLIPRGIGKKTEDLIKEREEWLKSSKYKNSALREIREATFLDKDVQFFTKSTGQVISLFMPVLGASVWFMGEIGERQRKLGAKPGIPLPKAQQRKVLLDAAIRGAIFGFLAKGVGKLGRMAGQRILLTGALRSSENLAARAAINQGGILIKVMGRGAKNLITAYFFKDILGDIYEVTADVKAGRFDKAIRKVKEVSASFAGYWVGGKLVRPTISAALWSKGKLVGTQPEFLQKKIPLDVMAKQLLSEGKITLTRRGVYETGKGLSPRKDAWLDSKVKNPTKSIFWRFDKTLSKKDQAISALPLFTKGKSSYFKMFKANWAKNKKLNPVMRYIKTIAETPVVDDVVIRRVVKLKDIKDKKLRASIIKQLATTGKLDRKTQEAVLKKRFPISDKNREFGFHDENEFVTRTQYKLKGRTTDISWTYDPSIGEYVPVIQNMKNTNALQRRLSVLNKKNIITRTDAKFILDNYKIKLKFKEKSILPKGHSYEHMKNVERNMDKLIDKYPEFNNYWIKKYGSVAKAKYAMQQTMWHDIGKTTESSKEFGTSHGEKLWRVWKAGLLPKGIKLNKKTANAIRVHETLDPRKLWYKVKNRIKLISPEEKILATADRLDLARYNIKIDTKRLPLSDAIRRLKLNVKVVNYPNKFKAIINKIKLDLRVTKKDIKSLFDYKKSLKKKPRITFKKSVKRPTKRPARRPKIRPAKRPKRRPVKKRRPTVRKRPRPRKRPTRRPPKRPTRRLPKRPKKRPPKRPTRRPGRPPARPKKKPQQFGRLEKGFTKKKLKKSVPGYYVVIKREGKLIKLTPRPMKLDDARDFLAYKIDRGLSRSAWFEPIGKSKNVVKPPIAIQGYYSKIKKKLRPYKIRVGKKRAIRNGYIEKKKYVGDTRSEIRALQKARRRRPHRKVKRRPKRRPVSQVRKIAFIGKSPGRRITNKQTRKRKRRPVKKRRVVRRNGSASIIRRRSRRRPVKRRPKRSPTRRVVRRRGSASIIRRRSRRRPVKRRPKRSPTRRVVRRRGSASIIRRKARRVKKRKPMKRRSRRRPVKRPKRRLKRKKR